MTKSSTQPPRDLSRERVTSLLSERWSQRLLLVEAAGGFGKTTAIQHAIADNESDPSGLDVYVRVSSSRPELPALMPKLLSQLVEDSPSNPDTNQLVDRAAARSPQNVAFIIDDAHHLQPVADRLVALIDELPANAHVVLVGRDFRWLPLARLRAAGAVSRVGADDLAFTPEELHAFADLYSVDEQRLVSHGGWPAITRLAAMGEANATAAYLFEEIVARLDRPSLLGIIAASMVDELDTALLTAVGGGTIAELSKATPLSTVRDGRLRCHDLWRDRRSEVFDSADLSEVGTLVIASMRERNEAIPAALLALEIERIDDARAAIIDSAFVGERFLSPEIVTTIIERFTGVVDALDPVLLLLSGILHRSQPNRTDTAFELHQRAVDGFRLEGNRRGEAAALIGELDVRWARGDTLESLVAIVARCEELASEGVVELEPLRGLSPVVLNDLAGNFASALAACLDLDRDRLSPTWVDAMDVWQLTLYGLCGRASDGLALSSRTNERMRTAHSEFYDVRIRFEAGDPLPAIALRDEGRPLDVPTFDNYDEIQVTATWATLAAAWGESVDETTIPTVVPRTRERAYAVVGRAASRIAAHDEDHAREVFQDHLEQVGVDDVLSTGELRRWPAYAAVLSPLTRDLLLAQAHSGELGTDHLRGLRIGSALLDGRDEVQPITESFPAPQLVCALPLPWTIEFALRTFSHDEARGSRLLDELATLVGSGVSAELRHCAAEESRLGELAAAYLRAQPTDPLHFTSVSSFGRLTITTTHGETELSGVPAKLLSLLIASRTVRRSVAASMLWPNKSTDRADASLRVALNAVRIALEPDRIAGQPSFHIRSDEGLLTLAPSPHLQIDLWDLLDAAGSGRRLEQDGKTRAAAEAYRPVLSSWPSEALPYIRDVEGLEHELASIDNELAEATVRYGELALALGDTSAARRASNRALVARVFEERAFRIRVQSAALDGDGLEARRQAEACVAWLAEFGLTPMADTRAVLRRWLPDTTHA